MDGSVNTIIIDQACQQIKAISEMYPTWKQLHQNCLFGLDWLVAEMLPTCHNINLTVHPTCGFNKFWIPDRWLPSSKEETFCQGLGKSSYTQYESLLRDIQFEMASDLNTTNVNVVTDTAVSIINEVFVPVDQQYHVVFNVTWDRLRESTIKDNTFRNLHIYLDSSKGSINIKKNKFNRSGITIFRDIGSIAQTIIMIQDNLFQGEYQRPILEFRNTGNISLKVNDFKNLQFTYSNAKKEELNSSILCINSQIEISNSAFKRVNINTVLRFNYCIIEMVNVTVLENTPPVINTSSTVINMVNSRGNFSNTIFTKNKGRIFMNVQNGELLVQNISISGNEVTSETMMNIGTSNISLLNVTTVNNKGHIMTITESSGNISTTSWEQNSGNGTLLEISDSDIDIYNLLFANNFQFEDSQFILLKISDDSSVTITRSNFIFNKAKIIELSRYQAHRFSLFPPSVKTTNKPLMGVSSCRFEGNYVRENTLVFGLKGVMQFTDSIFINNTVQTENDSVVGVVGLTYRYAFVVSSTTFVVFDNCNVLHNSAHGSTGFINMADSSVSIINCLFMNNSASNDAGVIYIIFATSLTIQNTVFDSNSCGVDGGAIYANQGNILLIDSNFTENRSFYSDGGALYLALSSNVTSKNCTFGGNMAAMEGGAVVVTDRSTYRDIGSLFLENTASNSGKYEEFSFCQHYVNKNL